MSIDKMWFNSGGEGHNIVLLDNNILYKRKVKRENYAIAKKELNDGIISEKFLGLPISYVKRMEYQDDDNAIIISYGKKSVDTIEISDQKRRKEVFEYLKSNTAVKNSGVKKPGLFSRIKKPLIALGILTAIFAYVYYLIDSLNQGYEFEVVGGGSPGVAGVFLGLAYLGLSKNLMIFVPLALIAIFKIKTNFDKNSDVHYITY